MARSTRTGRPQGFTLVELMAVIVVVLLLAGISVPLVYRSIVRAKESTLLQTLTVTRRAIDDYYSDHGKYPPSLDVLRDDHYLRAVPYDPLNKSADNWMLERSEDGGVMNLHSGSSESSSDGTAFSSW